MKGTTFILMFLVGAVFAMAQKTEKVRVEYTYYADSHENVQDAKHNAFEQGKIQAIADVFGTIVSSTSSTILKTGGASGEEIDDFMQLGSSEVKGEWLETTREAEYDIEYADGKLVVHVTGEGLVREIVSAKVDYKAKILCNGTEDKFERSDFRNGDDLYVSFTSPVEGYLVVYLLDNNKDAYCLLPYQEQRKGVYHVNANQRYVLFSQKSADAEERPYVDEYTLTAELPVERNQIYILFSPNKFSKASDAASGTNTEGLQLPRHLKYKDFQKWLAKCRKHDKQMCLEKKIVTITKD